MAPDREDPTVGEMLQEILDLGAGLAIVVVPLFLTAVPGLFLFFVLPAVLLALVLAVPVIALAAIAAPPILLVRAIRRRRAVAVPRSPAGSLART
jgi:Flp pilus assembly protein TadB